MMQVGVFTAYFPYSLEETARKIRALGFNTVQLDLHFKDMDLSPGQITRDKCLRIRETFRDHDLPVSCISGYTNIIHPDRAERDRRLSYLKEIIRHAQYLGSPYVISETGTYNTASDWVAHPKNRTPEGAAPSSPTSRRRPMIMAPSSCSRPTSTTWWVPWRKPCGYSRPSTTRVSAC